MNDSSKTVYLDTFSFRINENCYKTNLRTGIIIVEKIHVLVIEKTIEKEL